MNRSKRPNDIQTQNVQWIKTKLRNGFIGSRFSFNDEHADFQLAKEISTSRNPSRSDGWLKNYHLPQKKRLSCNFNSFAREKFSVNWIVIPWCFEVCYAQFSQRLDSSFVYLHLDVSFHPTPKPPKCDAWIHICSEMWSYEHKVLTSFKIEINSFNYFHKSHSNVVSPFHSCTIPYAPGFHGLLCESRGCEGKRFGALVYNVTQSWRYYLKMLLQLYTAQPNRNE